MPLRIKDLMEIASSEMRLRLISLVSERPRSISESADALRVTPQAVLKHTKMLGDKGLIEIIPTGKEGGLTRQLFRLIHPVDIESGEKDDVTYLTVRIHHGKYRAQHEYERRSKLIDIISDIEDELFGLTRRKKNSNQRSLRLFRKIAELSILEEDLMNSRGLSTIQKLVLKKLASSFDTPDLKELSESLKISAEKLMRISKDISTI